MPADAHSIVLASACVCAIRLCQVQARTHTYNIDVAPPTVSEKCVNCGRRTRGRSSSLILRPWRCSAGSYTWPCGSSVYGRSTITGVGSVLKNHFNQSTPSQRGCSAFLPPRASH
ncbi:hypothetical protein JB92DRAFT_864806 [Gautieria morchelliformis]|nr:hypothetical protein JB92DRAFT_864806 [Gautieria morchelliformis]